MLKSIMFQGAFLPALIALTLLHPGQICAQSKTPTTGESTVIQRGEYLVKILACNDCHSPKIFGEHGPQPDPSRILSGHPAETKLPSIPQGSIGPDKWGGVFTNDLTAWVGPWGVSFASNLTPDKETGIGAWTDELFIKSLRTGKHFGIGRQILPPMPWPSYGQLDDGDLKAIFGYLHSLKPIKNQVPQPMPPITPAQ